MAVAPFSAWPLHVYGWDRKLEWVPLRNAARMLAVVGVPEIVLSTCWTFITVAKPAVEIESISVPGAAHFFMAASNSCACELVPLCSMNGEAMYMPFAPPAAAAITGGAPHGSMPMILPEKPTLFSDFSTLPQPFGTST